MIGVTPINAVISLDKLFFLLLQKQQFASGVGAPLISFTASAYINNTSEKRIITQL